MDIYSQIIERIIKQQESIIGPVAIEQAEHVPNLDVDWPKHKVSVKGDGAKVIDNLVEKYKNLFGRVSVEVSREAAGSLLDQLPKNQLPKSLAP
jgi:hypothetical protein